MPPIAPARCRGWLGARAAISAAKSCRADTLLVIRDDLGDQSKPQRGGSRKTFFAGRGLAFAGEARG